MWTLAVSSSICCQRRSTSSLTRRACRKPMRISSRSRVGLRLLPADVFGRILTKCPRLLEVNVVALKPTVAWQVCDWDTVVLSGIETSRETAQIEADGALFFLLSQT